MKKKIIIICIAILITALVTTIILNFNNIFYKATNLEKTENVVETKLGNNAVKDNANAKKSKIESKDKPKRIGKKIIL